MSHGKLVLVSLWSLFGLSLVSPWSLFAPRDTISFVVRIKKRLALFRFSLQSTGGVFASCVFHSHHTSTFPSSLLLRSRHDSSTDDAAGADQGSARRRDFSRREGFHQADYVFQTGSHQKSGMARRARRRGMWIVTVSFHFAVCAFVSDTRLLETS